MRRSLIALLATTCVLAGAPAARAASLVFVDSGGDVAIARPDGSDVRKVTHAADADNGYKGVSVADDGGITAFLRKGDDSGNSSFVVLGQDGAVRQGPFLFERYGICGGLSPFRTSTSPDGTFVAVQYWKGSSNCLGGSPTPSVRLVARNSPTVGTSTYPSYDYLTEPHWLRHPDARLAGINGGTLSVWQNDASHMDSWIALPVGSPYAFAGFDFHPTQTRLLLDLAPATGTGVQPHRLELYSYTEMSVGSAAPTDPSPQLLCALDGYVSNDTGGGRPRWSPDGTQIAWDSPAGTYVSPAPVANGGTCELQPRLAVPGAIASWAPFDVAAAAGTGPPAGSGAPGGTGAPPAGGGSSAGTKRPALAFRAAKAVAATRGFRLQLTLAKAATVSVTVTRRGAKKALGILRYKAKKGPFRRTITKVHGKRLKRGTYKVVVTSGKTKKTLTVRVRRPVR
ncbi:hypothetical protein AB0L40_02135 [Patulibacter sp. NPDC049589]|uniref:hypothetical protein n=1 Tax=Patulibacter sp. NPDC049589 TaxID=3154731 RepID=UPI003444AB8A